MIKMKHQRLLARCWLVAVDRMNGMYEQDYQFRDVYMLSTAAEDEDDTSTRAEAGLKGWIDCYPKSRLAGTLFCGGVNDAREIEGNPKLQEAYELGKRLVGKVNG